MIIEAGRKYRLRKDLMSVFSITLVSSSYIYFKSDDQNITDFKLILNREEFLELFEPYIPKDIKLR